MSRNSEGGNDRCPPAVEAGILFSTAGIILDKTLHSIIFRSE